MENYMKKLFALAVLSVSVLPLIAQADSPQEERRERHAELIEKAFERDNVLRRFDLDADSEGGRTGYIEIEGKVRNASQRDRAYNLARRTAPGYRIINRITIRR
jgi:septin family protein